MKRWMLGALAAGVFTTGATFVTGWLATGFWCPRCEADRITESLRAMSAEVAAINRDFDAIRGRINHPPPVPVETLGEAGVDPDAKPDGGNP